MLSQLWLKTCFFLQQLSLSFWKSIEFRIYLILSLKKNIGNSNAYTCILIQNLLKNVTKFLYFLWKIERKERKLLNFEECSLFFFSLFKLPRTDVNLQNVLMRMILLPTHCPEFGSILFSLFSSKKKDYKHPLKKGQFSKKGPRFFCFSRETNFPFINLFSITFIHFETDVDLQFPRKKKSLFFSMKWKKNSSY